MSRKSGVLTYPEPLGPPRPVAGDLYLFLQSPKTVFTFQSESSLKTTQNSAALLKTAHKVSFKYDHLIRMAKKLVIW
jgi:hypothetical protein